MAGSTTRPRLDRQKALVLGGNGRSVLGMGAGSLVWVFEGKHPCTGCFRGPGMAPLVGAWPCALGKPKLDRHQQKETIKRLKAGESCLAIAKTFRVHHANRQTGLKLVPLQGDGRCRL
jgi:hypothetical protein